MDTKLISNNDANSPDSGTANTGIDSLGVKTSVLKDEDILAISSLNIKIDASSPEMIDDSHPFALFPLSAPVAPTRTSQHDGIKGSELNHVAASIDDHEAAFGDLAIICRSQQIEKVPNFAEFSTSEEERHSTITAQITPELTQNSWGKHTERKNLPPTPPVTPNKIGNIAKPVDGNNILSSVEVGGGGEIEDLSEEETLSTELHFNDTLPEWPLTPPVTPIKEPQNRILEGGSIVIPVDALQVEKTSEKNSLKEVPSEPTSRSKEEDFPVINQQIIALLNSIHSHDLTCSECASFEVDSEHFRSLSADVREEESSSSSSLPSTPSSSQIPTNLISHMIALVPVPIPGCTSSRGEVENPMPTFYAGQIGSADGAYREIGFSELATYHAFRRSQFSVRVYPSCASHARGYVVWIFSHREPVYAGFGRRERELRPVQMAMEKQGVLLRKFLYYAR